MADSADPSHEDCRLARDSFLREGGRFVTTDYVLDETLTLIRIRLGPKAASAWWAQVENSPRIRWEWMDALRTEKARSWFFQWTDKDFSFTDCTSFVVMKELRIKAALTTDRHFLQAGFELLP